MCRLGGFCASPELGCCWRNGTRRDGFTFFCSLVHDTCRAGAGSVAAFPKVTAVPKEHLPLWIKHVDVKIQQIKLKLFQWHPCFACHYQVSPSFLRLLHLPRRKHTDFVLAWFYSTIYFFCFSLGFPFPCSGHPYSFSKQAHIYLYI